MQVEPVHSAVPTLTQKQDIVQNVYKLADGNYKIEQITYTVSLYDHNGVLKTYTTSNAVDILL